MASKMTKKYKRKFIIMKTFSILVTILPLIVYVIIAFAKKEIGVTKKSFLTMTLVSALMLTLLNIFKKYNLRSPLFLIILGIYFCLDKILTLMIIISIGVVLDEFIFHPMAMKCKRKFSEHSSIDERLEE